VQQDSAQNAQAAQQRQDGQQGQYSRRTLLRRFTVAAAAGLLGLAATGGQECRAAASQDLGVLNALKTRRSVRKYTAAPVEEDLVREILRCGMQAPSACNEQPWQFVVLRNKALLAKVGGINPYAKFAKDAPVAILVCGDMRLDKCQGYWVQDCSNCAMNMLLAAHALGLGAVWTGIYPSSAATCGWTNARATGCRTAPTAP